MSETVSAKAQLNYAQMRALLKTLADDDHALIKKLEIRHHKSNGEYTVVANVERVENPGEEIKSNQKAA